MRDTAYWPPVYPGFLAAVQALFGEGVRTSQLAGCASGGATIALTGLLGRCIGGRAVGLLAALLVALSPFLIAVDGSLMAETLYLPLVLLALLLAQHARTRPSFGVWCALGAVIGLAALTRGDALFLIAVAAIPAAFLTQAPARQLVPRLLLGLGAMAIVLAPWIVRNAIEVDDPTISTISANGVLAGSNCDRTYDGPAIGYWRYDCMRTALGYTMTEAEYSAWLRRRGINYALDHADRWPAVAAARVGRVWGVWDPRDQTRREAMETRNLTWQRIAWPISLATLAVGLLGFRVLAKQHRPIAMLVAPAVMATLVALATYGNPRFRTAAEPALLIGVAAAIRAGIHRLRGVSSLDRPHPGGPVSRA
jgi:4-amino-4-deoxy-L-arabinose transferase-like glycosyltransferase